ncbi:L-threonine 3-dehydrogenase [Sistotremastrum niveocremeum HHB9708]|uniref:L-threonine 3-dehydrogenase n=2 Tax=Sistotremastraceae TaxID=3402574 RepID=A0A164UVV0_9AGAM|nr:L-threonine 3-dehydrogenase [Sistotremastrum niveocremeum HHB9708]KZT42642.1 alcohol dehydrogenase GroES domain-containing protein [Sistotremastrum suecicum HHB10207 ss-3]
MKAARFHGKRDIRIDEIPEPTVGPSQLKIKVAWNGICGSDLHDYLAGPIFSPQPGKPHPLSHEEPPVVFGHEISGTIVELGPDVDTNTFEAGRHVVIDAVVGCGTCSQCSLGLKNLCATLGLIGITGWGGGLSEYIVTDQRNVHVIPDSIPLDVAACIEPLAVAWHAANRANFQPGMNVLISGGGPIGLFVLKVLKARGAGKVYVSEPSTQRRNRALAHGADAVFNPLVSDVFSQVIAFNEGAGVEIAFECAGITPSLDNCLKCTRSRGTVCIIALWENEGTLNPNVLVFGEKVITGSACYVQCHPDVIAAVADGRINNVADLITRRIGLKDVVELGFEALVNDKENQIKILVRPA